MILHIYHLLQSHSRFFAKFTQHIMTIHKGGYTYDQKSIMDIICCSCSYCMCLQSYLCRYRNLTDPVSMDNMIQMNKRLSYMTASYIFIYHYRMSFGLYFRNNLTKLNQLLYQRSKSNLKLLSITRKARKHKTFRKLTYKIYKHIDTI